MIIKQATLPVSRRISWTSVLLIVGLLLTLAVVWLAASLFQNTAASAPKGVIFCGAERVSGKGETAEFRVGKATFGNGITQSDEKALTGSFSSRVDAAHPYGFGYEIKDPVAGDRYCATVFRYRVESRSGFLTSSANNRDLFYKRTDSPQEIRDDGWERLELNFMVPHTLPKGEPVKIYVHSDGSGIVYFDDLRIEKLQPVTVENDTVFRTIHLKIDENGMRKLEEKREEALRIGILFASDDDWVKGRIEDGKDRIPVSLRLKGDWLDHLKGRKWSFRIKAKAPYAWNRMITFSVQTPLSRDFLSEWVYHQLLEKEDVLTTRYDFVTVKMNNISLGVYAYEEHFEKQLPEFRQRREGPIIRLTEEGAWGARRRELEFGLEPPLKPIEGKLNAFEAGDIRPFKEGKTANDSTLGAQFDIAHTLLNQYKFGQKPANAIFDLERMAKFFAIIDLTEGYHSLIWHKLRFYYNPVTGKLEPIGFDGFTESGPMRWIDRPFIGYQLDREKGYIYGNLINRLMVEEDFAELYIGYLHRFSQPAYIEPFLFELDARINRRVEFLRQEFPAYSYDKGTLPGNAEKIRMLLFPFNDASVRANTESRSGSSKELSLSNFHVLPVQVLGFGKNDRNMRDTLSKPVFLRAWNPNSPTSFSNVKAPATADYVFFRVAGIDSIFTSAISPWKSPAAETPAQSLFSKVELTDTNLYRINGEEIIFLPGTHRMETDILIPEGFVVRMPAGIQIDLVKKAKFISKSPVFMYGTEAAPIHILSSDRSGNGFTVIGADEKSVMHYVVFDQLNTLDYKGWKLTGAVTFYESDVEIDHCSFINNLCEDALNTIRCHFDYRNSLISQTLSDGFDADFCTGDIWDARFSNTGNDGMDFSGSVIRVHSAYVESAGDKGLSVGEEATVSVDYLEVNGAPTGVASKDLSRLSIGYIKLKNCNTGFAAYQKKPEYGSAYISVDKYEAENVRHLHLIEKGSVLELVGKEAEGI